MRTSQSTVLSVDGIGQPFNAAEVITVRSMSCCPSNTASCLIVKLLFEAGVPALSNSGQPVGHNPFGGYI